MEEESSESLVMFSSVVRNPPVTCLTPISPVSPGSNNNLLTDLTEVPGCFPLFLCPGRGDRPTPALPPPGPVFDQQATHYEAPDGEEQEGPEYRQVAGPVHPLALPGPEPGPGSLVICAL